MIPKFRAWMPSLQWMCDVLLISWDAMPRLINLGNIAINSELVQYIDFIKKLGPNQTLLIIRINKLLSYREKEIRVLMDIDRVVARLNQY